MIHLTSKLSFMFILLLCSCTVNKFFYADKPQTGVNVEEIKEDITSWKRNSCEYDKLYDKTIRLKTIKKGDVFMARDYYSDTFYSIGELRDSVKIGIWKTYCHDLKVIEEFWVNGSVVWMKKNDINGSQIEFLNCGHPLEN